MVNKHRVLLIIILVSLSSAAVFGDKPDITTTDQIIVKFKNTQPAPFDPDPRGGPAPMALDAITRQNCLLVSQCPFSNTLLIEPEGEGDPNEVIQNLLDDPNVEYAERNHIAWAFATPNDTYFDYQWHFTPPDVLGGINLEAAWEITTGDPNVIVAVLDSGVAYEDFDIYLQAPDLAQTSFVPGFDFINGDTHPNDDNDHGTHVAGTIAQSTDNGLGVAGVAYDCSLMPVKVLSGMGSGSYFTIAQGIYFATDNGAHVINMSLGGTEPSTTLRDAMEYAYLNGVTVVCAAGNEFNEGNPRVYPAAYDQYCIAVGATRIDKTRAYYSSTGPWVDVAAPGGDVLADQNDDGYGDGVLQMTFSAFDVTDFGYWFFQGTSMASPHVAGIAALLYSKGVTDPDKIRLAIESTALDLGSPGRDDLYGHGLVDAHAALTFTVPGDVDGNLFVDLSDLFEFIPLWQSGDPRADFDNSGKVDYADYQIFTEYFLP